MASEQVNVRVPAASKSVISRVAKRLREDQTFVHRLGRFLDEEEGTHAGLLSERIDKVEDTLARVFQALPAEVVEQLNDLVLRAPSRPEPEAVEPSAEVDLPPFPWTSGEGKGRRLTEDGEAELHRLAKEGVQPTDIAKRLGIRAYAVRSRLGQG